MMPDRTRLPAGRFARCRVSVSGCRPSCTPTGPAGEPRSRRLGVGRPRRAATPAGRAQRTTNQRMEIQAALEAVTSARRAARGGERLDLRGQLLPGPVVGGVAGPGLDQLARRSRWPTGTCGSRFVELVADRGDVTFRWVKGHTGDPMNDLVDRLAVEAAATQHGRSGHGVPDELGPADSPGSAAPRHRRPGHRGPRPGGARPQAHRAGRLRRQPAGRRGAGPAGRDHRGQGGDRARPGGGERAAVRAPRCSGPRRRWRSACRWWWCCPIPIPSRCGRPPAGHASRRWPTRPPRPCCCRSACPTSKQQAGGALARRDAWLARNAAEAVVVWDGVDPALGKLHRSLEDHLGDDVWVLDPAEL